MTTQWNPEDIIHYLMEWIQDLRTCIYGVLWLQSQFGGAKEQDRREWSSLSEEIAGWHSKDETTIRKEDALHCFLAGHICFYLQFNYECTSCDLLFSFSPYYCLNRSWSATHNVHWICIFLTSLYNAAHCFCQDPSIALYFPTCCSFSTVGNFSENNLKITVKLFLHLASIFMSEICLGTFVPLFSLMI